MTLKKKVLIVSPNWPPVSHPDMHRLRMALPYLNDFGWQPIVLKVDPNEQEGTKDEMLCRTVPDDVHVEQVGSIPLWLTVPFGLRNVGLRSIFHLARAGDRIIKRERPELVFVSTTMFPLMILGRYWKWRHGLNYVLDFQDPWVRTDFPGTASPARSIKGKIVDRLADWLEPVAMKRVSQVITVSPAYSKSLSLRYRDDQQFTVLPFGAPEKDFELLRNFKISQTVFNQSDGFQHWLYAGRGGHDMVPALNLLFLGIAAARKSQASDWENIKLHFVGTTYAPAGRAQETVRPVAKKHGVGDIVEEIATRLPYFETLKALTEADELLIIGSDSPSYSASKLYPYMLARRPMLSILHEDSPAVDILRRCDAGKIVTFRPENLDSSREIMIKELEGLRGEAHKTGVQLNESELKQYTAREMTRKLCEVFDRAVARGRKS